MRCDECGTALYQAGEIVPAGAYMRVDDGSFRRVRLGRRGALPASFDGHVAEYCRSTAPCACERRYIATVLASDQGEHELPRESQSSK